jgi:hypothetical protein
MADDADMAGDDMDVWLPRAIEATRADIQPGVAGECELCGEWSGRLIGGACAPCRDKHGLR